MAGSLPNRSLLTPILTSSFSTNSRTTSSHPPQPSLPVSRYTAARPTSNRKILRFPWNDSMGFGFRDSTQRFRGSKKPKLKELLGVARGRVITEKEADWSWISRRYLDWFFVRTRTFTWTWARFDWSIVGSWAPIGRTRRITNGMLMHG